MTKETGNSSSAPKRRTTKASPTRKTTRSKSRSTTKRVSPPKKQEYDAMAYMPETSFHEVFPITLEHKDCSEYKICYFVCKEHMDKYIQRYNLKKGSYKTYETEPRKAKNEGDKKIT